MQYICLIYSAETAGPAPDTPEWDTHFQGYMDFTKGIRENGTFVAGEPLEKVSTATTVRVRDGKTETTDGPFAETKEQLGGFYIIDCDNIDEAIETAAKIPSAAFGSIEVRPVMSIG